MRNNVCNQLQPGLVSVTFRKFSPAEVISLAKENGVAGIEWGGDVHVPHGDIAAARTVRKLTEDAGIHVAAYGSYFRLGKSESEGLRFAKVLASAIELGAPTIRIWAGDRGSAAADPPYRHRLITEALRLADLAAAARISLSFEYHPATLTDTNESAQQLLGELNHPNIFTLWQPPLEASVEYALAGLRAVLPRLTNVHISEYSVARKDYLPLSAGQPGWTQYIATLRSSSRSHYILLEFTQGDSPANFSRDMTTLRQWLGI